MIITVNTSVVAARDVLVQICPCGLGSFPLHVSAVAAVFVQVRSLKLRELRHQVTGVDLLQYEFHGGFCLHDFHVVRVVTVHVVNAAGSAVDVLHHKALLESREHNVAPDVQYWRLSYWLTCADQRRIRNRDCGRQRHRRRPSALSGPEH